MKKTLKSLSLVLLMGIVLVSLAACGTDKLVATKSTDDDFMGSYKEEIVVEFKNDKATKAEMSMEFETEEKAQSMYSLYNLGASMSEDGAPEGLEVKVDGKKFVVVMDAKAFAESEGEEENNLTKDQIKASLEEDGYTVK